MSWDIKIAKKISKQIKRFPKKDKDRIFVIFEQMASNPYSGDIEKIEGEESLWRRRIGNYRISYDVYPKQKIIDVVDAQRRTTTTYRKKK